MKNFVKQNSIDKINSTVEKMIELRYKNIKPELFDKKLTNYIKERLTPRHYKGKHKEQHVQNIFKVIKKALKSDKLNEEQRIEFLMHTVTQHTLETKAMLIRDLTDELTDKMNDYYDNPKKKQKVVRAFFQKKTTWKKR